MCTSSIVELPLLCLRRLVCTLLALLCLPLSAQAPVPTLPVPTLVPQAPPTSPSPISESALADIQATGIFRAGILYNDPPYSSFTWQGQLSGFEADLLGKIAETWGSELELVQATRVNAQDLLERGAVHVVAAAILPYRAQTSAVDFSHAYFLGQQALMLRSNSPYEDPAELRNLPLGTVMGERSETALALWGAGSPPLNISTYLTLDRAYAALSRGDIAGLVAERQALLRISRDFPDSVRILAAPLLSEPRALALRRQDAPLRHLLNRSLQFLAQSGAMDELYRASFPDEPHDAGIIPLWGGIGTEIRPSQYSSELRLPQRSTIERLQQSGLLRVADSRPAAGGSLGAPRRLQDLNRALLGELALRWGLSLQLVPSAAADAIALLDSGQVDMIVGLAPTWREPQRLDFSMPYLLHGERLMVRANSGIDGFSNLRGRIVGILPGETGTRERAQAWADSINVSIRFFETSAQAAALNLLDYNNVNAVYADNLALLQHLQAYPDDLVLTDRWYSRAYFALGLRYNDVDFRLLVDYSLQEMALDGSLQRLTAPLMQAEPDLRMPIQPGASEFAGFKLTRPPATQP